MMSVRRPAAAGLAGLFGLCRLAAFLVLIGSAPRMLAAAQPEKASLPELTGPVNDFAHVIDPANAEALDRMIRTLMAATSDVVVVATVQSIEPFGNTREYANKLFENHGRGIGFLGRGGDKGQDNG